AARLVSRLPLLGRPTTHLACGRPRPLPLPAALPGLRHPPSRLPNTGGVLPPPPAPPKCDGRDGPHPAAVGVGHHAAAGVEGDSRGDVARAPPGFTPAGPHPGVADPRLGPRPRDGLLGILRLPGLSDSPLHPLPGAPRPGPEVGPGGRVRATRPAHP